MEAEPLALPEVVQSHQALERLIHDLVIQPRIAVDTESNSLHAYREQVCLMQFSTGERDYVVDPLALDDLKPLGAIFSNPHVEKIFHAAEYDLACLRRDFGYSFANIFDTMQASRTLGRTHVGLDYLLLEIFQVKVNKRLQKADWGKRPLTADLLRYACMDTHYLTPLRDLLQAELEAKQLWQLAQEDFRMACNGSAPKPKEELPAWMRFGVRRDLSLRDLTILDELVNCREQIAAALDRPVFKVIDDERLVSIAQARPGSVDELEQTGLGRRQAGQWGASLLEAVARGLQRPLVKKQASPGPSGLYLKRLRRLKDWRKKAALDMAVDSDVVLPRPLLLALAEGGSESMRSVMRASPWRLEHFGDQISQVLQKAAE